MSSQFIRDELINIAVNLKVAPSESNLLGRALNLLEKPDASVIDIADILKNDIGITSKLISIANSAFYRIGMPVHSIERAVIMMGQRELKSIIFSLYYLGKITNFLKLKKENLSYLLKHSIFVAHGARVLSKRLLVEDPEDVFTIALLHDIGKIVFFMIFDRYNDLINESLKNNTPLPVLERERLGIDHQEIGSIIALKWKLPPVFLSIIENHHNDRDGNNNGFENILRLICCADTFFYYKDRNDYPEAFILKKESESIDEEIEKIIYIINS
ncbi:MAG TPA: HDOD domain-containing protein [Syntrophorhabdaceae bacterium]|nr:HDOD domain-containing protein [Syntrophorhabdaceae bacterium]